MQVKNIENFTLEDITSHFHPQGRRFPTNAIYHAKITYNRAVKTNLQSFQIDPAYKAIIIVPSCEEITIDTISSIVQSLTTNKICKITHSFYGTYKHLNFYWSRRSITILFKDTSLLYSFCYKLAKRYENIPLLINDLKQNKLWLFTLKNKQYV